MDELRQDSTTRTAKALAKLDNLIAEETVAMETVELQAEEIKMMLASIRNTA